MHHTMNVYWGSRQRALALAGGGVLVSCPVHFSLEIKSFQYVMYKILGGTLPQYGQWVQSTHCIAVSRVTCGAHIVSLCAVLPVVHTSYRCVPCHPWCTHRIAVCRVTRGAHIEHLELSKKPFQFSCGCEQFH